MSAHTGDRGPWIEGAVRFRRDRTAMTALVVLILVVLACLAAPFYASDIARTDPFTSNIAGTIDLHGHETYVMQPDNNPLQLGMTPIGPTWDLAADPLGADSQGRDVAARLLYGGRVSLLIGITATLICAIVAAIVGIVAGFFGGIVDAILSRLMDVMWAVPVYLIAISLSIVTVSQGLHASARSRIEADNLLLPIAHHRHRLHPLHRPSRPRPGSLSLRDRATSFSPPAASACPGGAFSSATFSPTSPPRILVLAPLLMALNILAEIRPLVSLDRGAGARPRAGARSSTTARA